MNMDTSVRLIKSNENKSIFAIMNFLVIYVNDLGFFALRFTWLDTVSFFVTDDYMNSTRNTQTHTHNMNTLLFSIYGYDI